MAEQAFEPFFTTKPKGIGTGLGLSMVYGFVKQSGGHVKIYSEVGQGTTIKMYFPRVIEPRETVPTPAGQRQSGAGAARRDAGNDPAGRRRRYRQSLCPRSAARSRLHGAHGDRRAAGAVADSTITTIDLLFTDVVLPGGMNGRNLAEVAVKKKPDIKVLFATGYTRNAIIHHGRLDPDVEVLMKPYTYDVLARKIRAVLDNVRTAP